MDAKTQCGGRPLLRRCAFLGIGNRLWTHRRGWATLWGDRETTVRGTYMPNVVVPREDSCGGGDAMTRKASQGNEK